MTNYTHVQSHMQSLQRKLQERQVELRSKQEQLGSVLQESDAMRAVIAGQTVNKDDVVRMNQDKYVFATVAVEDLNVACALECVIH